MKDLPGYRKIVDNRPIDALLDKLLLIEERKLSEISEMDNLRGFTRRVEYWELLIRVLQNRDSFSVGLNELPSLCRYGSMHHQSLAKFIRDQIAGGTLVVEAGDRRDKKVVRASEQTMVDFVRLLDVR
jgi:hypothetical protein